MIITYELIISTTDKKLMLHPFPTIRLRGLIGECIYKYSKTNNTDLYRKFFKPTRPLNQLKILKRLILPKPYIILPPQRLHSEKILIHLRVFGHPNQYMNEVLKALTTTPCKLKLESATIVDEASQTRVVVNGDLKLTTYTTYHTLMEKASKLASNKDNIRLTLDFLTPFQLTRDGKPIPPDSIKPSDIVRYAARRLFILDSLYYSKGKAIPFPLTPTTVSQLMEWADKRIQLMAKLSTVKFHHNQHLLTGRITTQIPADERGVKTLFLLLTNQYLGIGKWTAYGMGQYLIHTEENT